MTFYGEKIIGQPTLQQIEIYVAEKGLYADAKFIYDYWQKKNWLTKKGAEIKTLETAIDVCNSIAVQRAIKGNAKKLGYTKLNKKDKAATKREIRKSLATGSKRIEDFFVAESDTPKKKAKARISYDAQLRDKRWAAFRRFVFAVRGNKCERCGSNDTPQVHHPKYKSGRLAWEYTCNEVVVLCRKCHRETHGLKE